MKATTSNHLFVETGTTGDSAKVDGYGQLNPNLLGGRTTATKSLVILTLIGDGDAQVKSTYRDKDGDFTVLEGQALSGANAQTAFISHADSFQVAFTDGAGDSDFHLDVFQLNN